MKNLKKILPRILLSAFFIYLTFKTSDINFGDLSQTLKTSNVGFLVLSAILIILNYVVSSYRWKDLLLVGPELVESPQNLQVHLQASHSHPQTQKPSLLYFIKVYFIGSFFNNFLITSIGGDAYKIFVLGKKIQSKAFAFATTFMDRFTGFLLLVLISYFGFIFTWKIWFDLVNSATKNQNLTYLFIGLALIGFWIGTFVFFGSLKVLSKKISIFKKLYDVLTQYKHHQKKLLWALFTSLIVQLLGIFTQYFVFSALGFNVPLSFALSVFPVITLAGFFIPSINGIGVQDFLYKELFLIVGIPPAISFSASILYHFLRLVVSLIGGVFYATGTKN